ncbi:MAG: hypothetical protein R2695_11185 [Acidimicrobiales bacterium]
MGRQTEFPIGAAAAIAVLAAVVTIAVSLWVFPDGGPIVDEQVYLQQARVLADGALVLPPEFAPDHVPFLTAPNDRGELVFKYTHAWPGVVAVSRAVTGRIARRSPCRPSPGCSRSRPGPTSWSGAGGSRSSPRH